MFEIIGRQLAEVCKGSWLGETQRASEIIFTGISTDSRTTKEGELFIPLQGENFDGHRFLEEAFRKGAKGAIVSSRDWIGLGNPQLLVEDTLVALQQSAAWWRQQFHLPVLAITGSSGKTTTKDIAASLLGTVANVHCNSGNQNNEIGVPLTLLGLSDQHQVCVLEMGMRGLGEIGELCAVAKPTSGIITNVGSTHFERLGSLENIARAKGELAESLPETGFILLNSENEWSPFISGRTKALPMLFGFAQDADVRAVDLDLGPDYSEFTLKVGRMVGEITCEKAGGKNTGKVFHRLRVPLAGEHNVYNCLAAIGAYLFLGFPAERLQEGLENIHLSGMRLQKLPGIRDSVIINDAYNANPCSMIASLKVLEQCEAKRRIAVLGDMFELGDIEEEEHRRVGEAVCGAKVDLLVTIGELAALIGEQAVASGMEGAKVFHGASFEEVAAFLKESIQEGDVLLVKGSRGMRMERFVTALQWPVEGNV